MSQVWVALGKSLPEFVYFAVEICHRGPLPSATPDFSLWQKLLGLITSRCSGSLKNFANQQNIKDAVVLGWGRQTSEKGTMGITAVTVKACQRNMKSAGSSVLA